MSTPIDILIELNFMTLELDEIQRRLNATRETFWQNQSVQLELDRSQRELDERRKFIKLQMLDIASRN